MLGGLLLRTFLINVRGNIIKIIKKDVREKNSCRLSGTFATIFFAPKRE